MVTTNDYNQTSPGFHPLEIEEVSLCGLGKRTGMHNQIT